ncbi:hypothetical protein BDZ89DRAFT_1039440 [Hymenopellis radicata]|nr:hypothetical protein BDZ89DRAFT_1039440 [Hymenopellis radicata]
MQAKPSKYLSGCEEFGFETTELGVSIVHGGRKTQNHVKEIQAVQRGSAMMAKRQSYYDEDSIGSGPVTVQPCCLDAKRTHGNSVVYNPRRHENHQCELGTAFKNWTLVQCARHAPIPEDKRAETYSVTGTWFTIDSRLHLGAVTEGLEVSNLWLAEAKSFSMMNGTVQAARLDTYGMKAWVIHLQAPV